MLIQIYLDDGRVFEYEVKDAIKGREHAAAIVASGYRASDGDDLEWYPSHRIIKVRVQGGAESSKYKDSVRAT